MSNSPKQAIDAAKRVFEDNRREYAAKRIADLTEIDVGDVGNLEVKWFQCTKCEAESVLPSDCFNCGASGNDKRALKRPAREASHEVRELAKLLRRLLDEGKS